MFSHNANLEGFLIDHLSCALLDHINEREWEITNWIFMTEYMYIPEECNPLLITRLLFPILFSPPKKKCCSLSTRAQRIRVLRFWGASNTFFFPFLLLLWRSQLDKHASPSPAGNPEKEKNATVKVLMKSKLLMWLVKLQMIWRIPRLSEDDIMNLLWIESN